MTIEIQRKDSTFVFRVNPDNPRVIDRKENKPRARWQMFRLLKSEEEARDALLRLEQGI